MATEAIRSGEFLLSEGNGHISREEITIASGAGVLQAGTILGKVTASGKYIAYSDAAADGSETAAGILYGQVDATSADAKAVAVVRHAEVKSALLTGSDANGVADLAALQIIVR